MEALAADPSLSRPAAAFALGLAKSYRAAADLRKKQAEWEASQRMLSGAPRFREREEQAERQKLRGPSAQLNAGIDPELFLLGGKIAAFHIEAGTRSFADFAAAIAKDLGARLEDLRPYLRSWYNGARDMMEDHGLNVEGLDHPDTVRTELARLLKEEEDAGRSIHEPSVEPLEKVAPAEIQGTERGKDVEHARPAGEPGGGEPSGQSDVERVAAARSGRNRPAGDDTAAAGKGVRAPTVKSVPASWEANQDHSLRAITEPPAKESANRELQRRHADPQAARMLGLGGSGAPFVKLPRNSPATEQSQTGGGPWHNNQPPNAVLSSSSSPTPPITSEPLLSTGIQPVSPELRDFGLSEDDLKALPKLLFGFDHGNYGVTSFVIVTIILFVFAFHPDVYNFAGVVTAVFGYFIFSGLIILPALLLLFIAGAIERKFYTMTNRRFAAYLRYKDALSAFARKETDYRAQIERQRVTFWKSLSGVAFERELGTLFVRMGYDVKHTPQTADGGIDLYLRKDAKLTIVQCKAHNSRIPISVARELVASMIDARADNAIIACFDGVTLPVADYIRDKRITVLDANDIIKLEKTATQR